MRAAIITAVGIGVSKYKSTVAARRPSDEATLIPFDISHDCTGIRNLLEKLHSLRARSKLSWSIQGYIGELWLLRYNRPNSSSAYGNLLKTIC